MGEALPDEDALAILDERPARPGPGEKVPDIGIVIDPRRRETTEGVAQQELLGYEPLIVGRPSEIGDPAQIREASYDWGLARSMFEPEVPEYIVLTRGLETPLTSVLDSCRFSYPSSRESRFSFFLSTHKLLRIVHQMAMIDVDLSPDDIRRGDLTLSDLLAHKGRSREFRLGPKSPD